MKAVNKDKMIKKLAAELGERACPWAEYYRRDPNAYKKCFQCNTAMTRAECWKGWAQK